MLFKLSSNGYLQENSFQNNKTISCIVTEGNLQIEVWWRSQDDAVTYVTYVRQNRYSRKERSHVTMILTQYYPTKKQNYSQNLLRPDVWKIEALWVGIYGCKLRTNVSMVLKRSLIFNQSSWPILLVSRKSNNSTNPNGQSNKHKIYIYTDNQALIMILKTRFHKCLTKIT